MATKTASASLTSSVSLKASTGFIYYQDGIIDSLSGTIKALGTGSWSNIKAWSSFKNYNQVSKQIRWTAPLLDLGTISYFTLDITTDFNGSLYFIVHISNTGDFNGEETEYYIAEGNFNVESFYGRYAYVTAFVNGNELRSFTIETETNTISYTINDVDSSTLSGSNTARVIALPMAVSKITDIWITPKAATPYAVNLYVSDSATSKLLIPVVVSKSNTTPTFALYGIDNDPRDGIVDIKISALPRMVMYGGKLTTIS